MNQQKDQTQQDQPKQQIKKADRVIDKEALEQSIKVHNANKSLNQIVRK